MGPAMNDRSPDPTKKTGNVLLDALDEADRTLLLAEARTRPIEVGTVLFRPGDAIGFVPFPTSGTISLLAQPDYALPVEAATIGREGAGCLHSALGSRRASQELVGQIDGEMIAVGIEPFVKQAQQGDLRELIYGYMEALVVQISLSAACNAVHHLNQRCARWLLQTHDRVDDNTFGLTQEYLGVMLGVQRPSVSLAQQTLQAAGCITYRRGSITVVDREALEAASCPCYEMIRTEYSRLVPLRIKG
jgi:CRP-like cAMP-binding protein